MKYWFNMGIQPTKVGFWDHVLLRSIKPKKIFFDPRPVAPGSADPWAYSWGCTCHRYSLRCHAPRRSEGRGPAWRRMLSWLTPQRAGWICGRAELDPKHWNWERHEKGKIFRLAVTFRSVVCFQGVAVSIADPCWNGIIQSCISSRLVSENHTRIWHPEHQNVAMDQFLKMQIFWGYTVCYEHSFLSSILVFCRGFPWPMGSKTHQKHQASIASLLPNLPSALAFRVLDSLASSFLGSAFWWSSHHTWNS